MPDFEGIYFDGKSTEPHAALVSLGPSALQITYSTQQNRLPVTVYWQAHRLLKDTAPQAGKTIVRYGNYPCQTLEVASPDFMPALASYYQATPLPNQTRSAPVTCKAEWGWVVIIFLLLLIPATYFWGLPATADFGARQIPPAYEYQVGQTLAAQLVPENKDVNQTANLRGFVRQLHMPMPYPLTFSVVREAQPNAFAIPGGHIVVHAAMFKLLASPEELVALLGHEYGHLKHRHSLRSLFRSLAGYIFISVLIGDVSALVAVIAENANALKSLEYSRDFEHEADLLGLKVMEQHRLNPRGMVQLFRHLQAHRNGLAEPWQFTSTHPALSARIRAIQNRLNPNTSYLPPSDSLQYFWQRLKNAAPQ